MSGRRLFIAGALWLWSSTASLAQTTTVPSAPEMPRADLAGTVGSLHVNKSGFDDYDDWHNRGFHASVIFGWHWSRHLKTEIEASATPRVEFMSAHDSLVNGMRAFVVSEHSFSTRRLTLAQQYQFGENAWFHPHLATGVDFNWEASRRFDREVHFYDPAARASRVIQQPITHPNRTDLHVRPFGALGLKSYVTPRHFFRTDVRVVGARRVEEVVLRVGFGIDF